MRNANLKRAPAPLADDTVCLLSPYDFHSVGVWYRDFPQTSDDEVLAILEHGASQ